MPSESQQLRNNALRGRIRQLIDEGDLPAIIAQKIQAGYGCGSRCLACGRLITSEQLEYQTVAPRGLRLHFGCHVVWQIQCVERARLGRQNA